MAERILKMEKDNEREPRGAEKIANSRVKEITIRLRDNPDNETIAHEFAHAFLVYHHFTARKMKPKLTLFLFYSLKDFFLREIEKFD